VLAPNEQLTLQVYNGLAKYFAIENKGPPKTFLSLNIIRTSTTLAINLFGYIDRMLARFHMKDAYVASAPLDPSLSHLKA